MGNELWNKYELAVLIELYAKSNNAISSYKEVIDSFLFFLEEQASELLKEYDRLGLEREIRKRLDEIAFFFGARPDKGNPSKLLVELIRLYKFDREGFEKLVKEVTPRTSPKENRADTETEFFQNELHRLKRFFDILSRNNVKYIDTLSFDGKIWLFPLDEGSRVAKLLKQRGKDTLLNQSKLYFHQRDISDALLKELEVAECGNVVELKESKEVIASVEPSKPNKLAKKPEEVKITKISNTNKVVNRKLSTVSSGTEDLTELLKLLEVEYYDLRPQRGQLWLKDSPEQLFVIIQLVKLGYKPVFSPKGYKEFNMKGAWGIKQKGIFISDSLKADLFARLRKFKALPNRLSLEQLKLQGQLEPLEAEQLIQFLQQYGLTYMDCRQECNQIRIILDTVNKQLEARFNQQGLISDFRYDSTQEEGYRSFWVVSVNPIEGKFAKQKGDVLKKTKVSMPKESFFISAAHRTNSAPLDFNVSESLLDEIVTKGIDYVDLRHINGKLWIIQSIEVCKLIEDLVPQSVGIRLGSVSMGGSTRNAYWIDVVEKGRASLTVKEKIPAKKSLQPVTDNNARPVSKTPFGFITPNKFAETINGEFKLLGGSRNFVDESCPEEKLYLFLEASREGFPDGLTAGYIAEAIHESKEAVKQVLDRAAWAERKSIHYRFINCKEKKLIVDFNNISSLAFTRPTFVKLGPYERVRVASWKEVLAVTAYGLYLIKKRDFLRLQKFNNADKMVDGLHLGRLKDAFNIGDDCWIELKRTPEEIVGFLKELMNICGLAYKYLEINYVFI